MAKKNLTWFQSVSKGGRNFVDLTNPINLAKLSNEERMYLEYQQRVYKYDLEANTQAFKNSTFGSSYARTQYKILTGELYHQSLDTFGINYAKAIEYNTGDGALSSLFSRLWNRLSYTDKYNFSTLDLPEIPIFYKIKLVADSKTNQANSISVEFALQQIASQVIRESFNRNVKFNYRKFKQAIEYATGYDYDEIKEIAKEERMTIKSIILRNLL